jgi:hypothetical protein
MKWWNNGSHRPAQKTQSAKIYRKICILDSMFLDQDGTLLIHYLPQGQIINTEYYSSLLVQLKDILKEKCRAR